MKNLALLAHVTSDEDNEDDVLKQICYDLGVEDSSILTGDEINTTISYLVFLNGLIIGIHCYPKQFIMKIRKLRRMNRIGEFVSIYLNIIQKAVYLASDGGRVCRPLLVLEGMFLSIFQL